MLANNKGADQPAHPRSLISAFIIRYLKSKVTRSDSSFFSIVSGGLRHDEGSGLAPVFHVGKLYWANATAFCTLNRVKSGNFGHQVNSDIH